MPLNVVADLDRKYDDGIYNTGELTSNQDYAGASTAYADLYWIAF
jgi:hypothetical protein